jgi:DNA polymerase
VLIGEAPGWREDQLGHAFAWKSGEKLDKWLAQVGLTRRDIYLTNLLRCYGGKGVPFPDDDEVGGPVDKCAPFLRRQLGIINPLAIIVAGRRALHHVVLKGAIGTAHPFQPWVGSVLRRRDLYGETRIGVMWHPAKLLRQYNPVDEQRCITTLQRVHDYVRARQSGAPAPMIDLRDIKSAGAAVYQQRMRLFGEEEDAD